MIRSFANRGTQDIWHGFHSKAARKICPSRLWPRALRKLDDLHHVRHYRDLRTPSSNRLHKLTGDRSGQLSIAINDRYRICFRWQGVDALDVEIADYHS